MAQGPTGNEPGKGGSSPRDANTVDLHVGNRIRLRRMLMGMSQEELGEHVGLTFQQIQKYEKGDNRISAGRLYRLAQVLGSSVQHFFEDLPSDPQIEGAADAKRGAEEPVPTFVYSREAVKLSDAFVRIRTRETRQAIVRLVRSLANDEGSARGGTSP